MVVRKGKVRYRQGILVDGRGGHGMRWDRGRGRKRHLVRLRSKEDFFVVAIL